MAAPSSPDWRERFAAVEARIAQACGAAGRARGDVLLVAVSKEQPDEAVRTLHALGVRDFGENRLQALTARSERLADLADVAWHCIGALQTNKAKDVARLRAASGGRVPALVHTIDRADLVEAFDKRLAGHTRLPCLIQVDIDREPQKAGVLPEHLDALVDALLASTSLELRGLMAIPRPREEVGEAALRRTFDAMRALTDALADRVDAPLLSLGMSDDFELAIAHGATCVRVGSALFGERPEKPG